MKCECGCWIFHFLCGVALICLVLGTIHCCEHAENGVRRDGDILAPRLACLSTDLWRCNGAKCFTSRRAITILSPRTLLPHEINRAFYSYPSKIRPSILSLLSGLMRHKWNLLPLFYYLITCNCYAVADLSYSGCITTRTCSSF